MSRLGTRARRSQPSWLGARIPRHTADRRQAARRVPRGRRARAHEPRATRRSGCAMLMTAADAPRRAHCSARTRRELGTRTLNTHEAARSASTRHLGRGARLDGGGRPDGGGRNARHRPVDGTPQSEKSALFSTCRSGHASTFSLSGKQLRQSTFGSRSPGSTSFSGPRIA
jgi:hypothetical protein